MYKVFVNDKPLFLTNHISKETDFQLFLLESIDIEQLIVKIFQNKINKAYLYHPDESLIMKTLKAKIPVCKAGGGLVYNKKGEYKKSIEYLKKAEELNLKVEDSYYMTSIYDLLQDSYKKIGNINEHNK